MSTAGSTRLAVEIPADVIEAIAARVAERLRAEFAEAMSGVDAGWLPTSEAATYAGCSPNALRKAMARGEIEFEQPAGPRGKAYFRRADLDAWRRRAA